jgi:hypothetical protein
MEVCLVDAAEDNTVFFFFIMVSLVKVCVMKTTGVRWDKTFLLLFLNVCFLVFNSFSQNPLVKQWDYRFGGDSTDRLTSFRQTVDKGFIFGGSSLSGISGDKTQTLWGFEDFWIVKTDSLCNKQWDRNFGGTENDVLYSLQQTADGGYILGGASFSGIGGDKTQPSLGGFDYWIIKIDSAGNKQWDKDFGGTDNDWLYSLVQTPDGGYLLGGFSYSGISGDKSQANWGSGDYWIIQTDSLGNKLWDKSFGGLSGDFFSFLQNTNDNGYILGGYSNSNISGDKTQNSLGGYDYWIIKIDSAGNKQWDKDFGGVSQDYLFTLKQTPDKGYILAGCTYSGIGGDKTQLNWGGYDYWILKTDSLGIKQWDKDFGGINDEDDLETVSQTSDGGYLIAGTSYSPISGDKTENNLGNEQTWVLKTNSLGIKQWDKTLHTNTISDDEIGFAIQTMDGCYAMANYTLAGIGGDKTQNNWDTTNTSSDYWIIKFCDTTSTTSIPTLQSPTSNLQISPNPSSGIFQITFPSSSSNLKTTYTLEVVNTLGQRVYTSPSARLQRRGENSAELDLSSLPKGMYVLKINDGVNSFSKKLVIQ